MLCKDTAYLVGECWLLLRAAALSVLASSSSGITSQTLSAKLHIYTRLGMSSRNSDTTILVVQSLIQYPVMKYSNEQSFCINDIASGLCHLRTQLAS